MDRLSISTGSWTNWLITGGFASVALPWCPAKRLLTQHIDAYKCVCKSILLNSHARTLLMNISVFTLLVSEEEQSWAVADVAGRTGLRCCLQGRDPLGRAPFCTGGSAVSVALPVKVKAVAVIA